MKQQKDGLQDGSTSIEIGGVTIASGNFKTGAATVSVSSNGEVTITIGGTENKANTATTGTTTPGVGA